MKSRGILAGFVLCAGISSLCIGSSYADATHDLMQDVPRNDVEAVRKDIANGADVNAKYEDEALSAILMAAVLLPNGEATVRLLIDAGADVNAKDKHGDTPLTLVAGRGNLSMIKTLVGAKARVNEKNTAGNSPLIIASAAGSKGEEAVRTFIDAGANVNEQNNYGDTSLMMAATIGSMHVVKALVEAGADVAAQPQQVCSSGQKGSQQTPTCSDGAGWTPLMFALDNNHPDVVEYLHKVMDKQRDSGSGGSDHRHPESGGGTGDSGSNSDSGVHNHVMQRGGN
jgi:ankyrin repeat protein